MRKLVCKLEAPTPRGQFVVPTLSTIGQPLDCGKETDLALGCQVTPGIGMKSIHKRAVQKMGSAKLITILPAKLEKVDLLAGGGAD